MRPSKNILILLGLCYVFFILGNGALSLTNPDEVFYSQTAKEMMQHKSWMTEYLFGQPQFEKPILTYWLLRIAFLFFGVSAFSARLFPALFAAIGIIAVYLLGLLGFRNEKKAFICSLILMSAGIYLGLARTVFTDMIFSVFILLALLAFFWAYCRRDRKAPGLLLFFIFSALAVLTKGPLGLLIPLASVALFLFARREIKFIFSKWLLAGLFIFAAISFPWYIFMIKEYGASFINEFFYNDHLRRLFEAEHTSNDTWYFYPFSMLMGMFPWAVYTLFSLVYFIKNIRQKVEPIYLFLACWIGAVFVAFAPAHSKLVSYIMPLFPALALLTGDFIYDAIESGKWRKAFLFSSFATLFILLCLPAGLIVAAFKFSNYIPNRIPVYILAAILIGCILLSLFFILRRRLWQHIYIVAPVIPIILSFAFVMHNQAEPYVSSKEAAQYLLKNHNVNGVILCSKFFVRGVRYYTDKDVAVAGVGGDDFFSPHPMPFLNSDAQIRDFLNSQPVTYCILSKSTVEDVQRAAAKDFKVELLKVIGDEHILKIEKIH